MKPAAWLGWLIPRSEREFALGDLEESYGDRPLAHCRELLRVALAIRTTAARHARHPPRPLRRSNALMHTLLNDLRYGIRQLWLRPGFTALAALTFALGIGATTAIFSVVNPILFQSLPYPDADRIVTLWERDNHGNEDNTGFASFRDVQRMATSLEAVAVTGFWQPTLQGTGEPERFTGQKVTEDYFKVLGVAPFLGRDFTTAEQVRGQHHVTILSYGLWQRRFGADRSIIGKPVTFDGIQFLVVGVMPKGFEDVFSPAAELWMPLAYAVSLPFACRTCHHLREIARLKPGISEEAARRELGVISGRLVAQYPTEYQAAGMFVIPLQTLTTRQIRPALLAVLGAVTLVLLISCINVSALLVGRSLQREGEFAIRAAMGAGRWRMARQLFVEGTLLSLLGGGVGLALAWAGVKALPALGPTAIPRLSAIAINVPVLAFTAGVSLITGIVFGLVPALAATSRDLFSRLRPGGKTTQRREHWIARSALVGGEIAMAVMLLVGAGLLVRSLRKLLAVEPGFDARSLLTMQVQTSGTRYNDNDAGWSFYTRALAAVRAIPGVEQAGWVSQLPLGGNFDRYGVQIEGRLLANPEEAPSADRYAIFPGYLQAMRIPILRGRGFTTEDDGRHPPVALVNEAFQRLSWAGEDPIGKRIQVGGPDQPWRTIVGVVGNVHHTGLDQPPQAQAYFPEVQWQFADASMDLVVRTRGDPIALARPVEAAIRSTDSTLPILNIAAMEDVISGTAQQRRFVMVLFQIFSVVALLLAAAGIYGVLAGSVAERTREIGIRSALGASRSGLLGLILRQGLVLSAFGLGVGSAGALLLSRFLQKLLFGIEPQDPLTFASVVAVLSLVALLACWIPARRATRISPLETLRSE